MKFRNHWLWSAPLLAASAALSACSTLDLRNAYGASKLDPLDIDAQHARIAVIWPKDVSAGNLEFSFDFTQDEKSIRKEVFTLMPEIGGKPPLIKYPSADNQSSIVVYRLPAEQVAAAKAFQSFGSDRKNRSQDSETKNETTMSFKAPIKPTGEGSKRYCDGKADAPFYVWYKLDEATPYKRIVRTKSIDKFFGDTILNVLCNPKAGKGDAPAPTK